MKTEELVIPAGKNMLMAERAKAKPKVDTFNISQELRDIITSVPADSKLCISFSIINIMTGESQPFLAKPPRKRVIRFKAGSELSSSVN